MKKIIEKYRKFLLFSVIGLIVTLLGSVMMYLFVDILHIEEILAYFLQTVIALQANFNLNKLITWKDYKGKYWNEWVRFHGFRLITIVGSQILFAIFVYIGMHYMIAYFINIALSTIVNFLTSDKYVFRGIGGTNV